MMYPTIEESREFYHYHVGISLTHHHLIHEGTAAHPSDAMETLRSFACGVLIIRSHVTISLDQWFREPRKIVAQKAGDN